MMTLAFCAACAALAPMALALVLDGLRADPMPQRVLVRGLPPSNSRAAATKSGGI
jgi:hypothetical protein